MGLQDLGYAGLKAAFQRSLNEAETGSFAGQIGALIPSDQEVETYRWLGATPQMREWVGGRLEKPLRDEVYTIRNRHFELTLGIDKDDIRRDKIGAIMQRVRDMGTSAALHWDELLINLIINGDATGYNCYDGQKFFDTDHVSGDSGTHKNVVTASEIAVLDVSSATAPTAEELAKIFVAMAAYFYTYKDDVGRPVNHNARRFLVMVPPTMYGAAIGAVSAQYLASGATNVAIAGPMNFAVYTDARLDWTTEIGMFRMDGAMRPFILQEEVPLMTDFIGPGSEVAFRESRYLFGVEAWRNAGYGLWQHAMKATLS